MTKSRGALGPVLTAIAGVAMLAAFPASAQQKVGAAGAVNPATVGTPPGLPSRTIFVGNDIVFNERIVTAADGQAQIVFLDRSAFSVGPNSEVVIDEFVYDPASGSGKIVATATKGVFRFIGGSISKNDGGVTVKTPSATIGIRGGMMGSTVGPEGTTAIKHFGDAVTVAGTGGATQTIYRNDFYLKVDGQGGFTTPRPERVTLAVQQAAADPLNPPPGTTGGATQAPTEVLIRQSGYPGMNSNDTATARANTEQRDPSPQLATLDVSRFSSLRDAQTVGQLAALNEITQSLNNSILNVGAQGLVRGQLVWTTTADLDLHLILPAGAGEVFFANRTITFNGSGATANLDHDNLGGTIDQQPNKRVENIVVVGPRIPAGTYTFFAQSFSDLNGSSAFTLSATGNRGITTQVQSGTLASGQRGANLPVTSAGGSFP